MGTSEASKDGGSGGLPPGKFLEPRSLNRWKMYHFLKVCH